MSAKAIAAEMACSGALDEMFYQGAEDPQKAALAAADVLCMPTSPWVCAQRCEPVIAGIGV